MFTVRGLDSEGVVRAWTITRPWQVCIFRGCLRTAPDTEELVSEFRRVVLCCVVLGLLSGTLELWKTLLSCLFRPGHAHSPCMVQVQVRV